MAIQFRILSWALIFLLRLCFPPGKSIAKMSMSLIIRTKSHSPSFVPWGTPAWIFLHSDLQSLPSFTLCLRDLRKSIIQQRIPQGRFNFVSFSARMEWSIKSKALLKSKRTLTVEPFPSVCFVHSCTILINACVVEDFGTVPNWVSSISFNTAGLTNFSKTKSSATFHGIGVREIGQRSLLTSLPGFSFGKGIISGFFHVGGNLPSWKEQLKISVIGFDRQFAFSFSSQAGTPSGPWAIVGFNDDNFLYTTSVETTNRGNKEESPSGIKLVGSGRNFLVGQIKRSLMALARSDGLKMPLTFWRDFII